MANGFIVTTTGRKIMMHRCYEGTPTYTAVNYFKVGTGTATPAIGDTVLTTPITINGNPTKAITTGYPSFDDTNLVASNRGLLLTTDCNGNSITEFGLVNSDGTPLLFNHSVFTAITKTISVQVIFLEKDVVS